MIAFYQSLVIAAVISQLVSACEITLRMKSKTDVKFKLQVLVPGIPYETPVFQFLAKEHEIIHMIKGESCSSKRWKIKIWKQRGGDYHLVEVHSTRFDGRGHINFEIDDDFKPKFVDRFGITEIGLF